MTIRWQVMEPAKETIMWQVATDQKYAKAIIALDEFISQARIAIG